MMTATLLPSACWRRTPPTYRLATPTTPAVAVDMGGFTSPFRIELG